MNENNDKWEILNVSAVEKALIVPFTMSNIREPNYEIQVFLTKLFFFALFFWEPFQKLNVKTINTKLLESLAVYPSNWNEPYLLAS